MLSIPNMLSLYRLAAAPVVAWMALAGDREMFFVLMIISLTSDLVDGPIARRFGQESKPGAKLDSISDACTVIAGTLGVFIFEGSNLRPELPWFCLFLVSYATAAITALAKFRTLPAYHLYLSKLTNFCAGAFLIWLFLFGYSRFFFLAVVGLGVLASIESLLVTMVLRRFRPDLGSLVRVLALRRNGAEGTGRDAPRLRSVFWRGTERR